MTQAHEHIERLSSEVVNRIAAGEVVQRPSAALKELLENALDAGSSSIQVSAAEGGLEVLQVVDDGDGIHHDDLPLLCERYATSKLRSFEDLKSIASFGFRGEALASISYVARVTVWTMRRVELTGADLGSSRSRAASAATAWKCRYADGVMVEGPTPCAGNPGTTIRVESMFYNSSVRRRALGRPSEEYSRIINVVARYALAFPRVAFACRKISAASGPSVGQAAAKADAFFLKDSTLLNNVRMFHGASIAAHLHAVRGCSQPTASTGADGSSDPSAAAVASLTGENGVGQYHLHGYVSDITLSNRKPFLCLFVNNRLVESQAIKKSLDGVYHAYLSGGNRYFVVLLVTVPRDRVDVNVHPTKHEVCLLDEELIVGRLAEAVHRVLVETSAAKQLALHRPELRPLIALPVSNEKNPTTGAHATTLNIEGGNASVPRAPYVAPPVARAATVTRVVAVAPSTIARVDQQRGALEQYLRPMEQVQVEHAVQSEVRPSVAQMRTVGELVIADEPHRPTRAALETIRGDVTCDDLLREGEELPPSRTAGSVLAVCSSNASEDGEATAVMVVDAPSEVLTSCAASSEVRKSEALQEDTLGSLGGAAELARLSDIPIVNDDEDDDDIQCYFKARRVEVLGGVVAKPAPDVQKEVGDDVDVDEGRRCREDVAQPTGPPPDDGGPEPVGAPIPEELEDVVLSSVERAIQDIQCASSPEVKAFFDGFSFVGIVDAYRFLAQAGTTLYLVDALRLVRHVVYQRLFLRWGVCSLPTVARHVFASPVPVLDLLWFAYQHDRRHTRGSLRKLRATLEARLGTSSEVPTQVSAGKGGLQDGEAGFTCSQRVPVTVERMISRLTRRLRHWRDMLSEYFAVEITADGCLAALPLCLGPTWPPPQRAVPLFLWRLATDVDFGDEFSCLTGVARLLAEVLYGMCVHPEWDEQYAVTPLSAALVQQSESQPPEVPAGRSMSSNGNTGSGTTVRSAGAVECSSCHCEDRGVLSQSSTPAPQHVGGGASEMPGSHWHATASMCMSPCASRPDTSHGNTPTPCRLLPSLDDAVRFGLIPCVARSRHFMPSASHLTDGTLCAVVTVGDLYKVFERC